MLCVLWLGSSVGNLKPEEAVGFFKSVQESAGPNVQVSTTMCTFCSTDVTANLPVLFLVCTQSMCLSHASSHSPCTYCTVNDW